MKQGRLMIVAATALAGVACSSMMMSTPRAVDRDAIVMYLDSTTSSEQVAQTLTQRGVEFAILSAPRDSAWFNGIATRTSLWSTRPGKMNGRSYAFIGLKALGDTTLTLNVTGGGVIRIHDALFEIDKNHHLDLMAVQLDSINNVQRAVNKLLEYIAGDVGATASVLFSIESASPAVTDSVSTLMRALYTDLYECTAEGRAGTARGDMPMRVYFGPIARMRCNGAEKPDNRTLLGHFEVGL